MSSYEIDLKIVHVYLLHLLIFVKTNRSVYCNNIEYTKGERLLKYVVQKARTTSTTLVLADILGRAPKKSYVGIR